MSEPFHRWWVPVEAEKYDLEEIQIQFPDKELEFEIIDDMQAFHISEFDDCQTATEVNARASDFVSVANLSLQLIKDNFQPIALSGRIVEKTPEGLIRRTLFAQGIAISRSRARAIGVALDASGAPIPPPPTEPTLAQRTARLIASNDAVREAALALASNPPSWGNLNLAFETIKGLSSPNHKRKEWEHLVEMGWATRSQIRALWKTAGYYRHGHPREDPPDPELTLAEGEAIVRALFVRLVEHLDRNEDISTV